MLKHFVVALFILLASPTTAQAGINETIDLTTRYLVASWKADKTLEKYHPPQVLPIAEGSKVYGACGEQVAGIEVGGSAYCGIAHTIYLVPSELRQFHNIFGPSAVAYVVAHEFGHALQAVYQVELKGASRELQADCLAGVFIGDGSQELGIARNDVVIMAQAAYEIGSESHGSGPQRSYALLSGMGVFSSSCTDNEMQALANGTLEASELVELSRSSKAVLDTTSTPYPKTVKSALGV